MTLPIIKNTKTSNKGRRANTIARSLQREASRELDTELRRKQIQAAIDRRRRGDAHGKHCDCPYCQARYEEAEAKANEIVPVADPYWGWIHDGTQPMNDFILNGLAKLCPWKKSKRTSGEGHLPGTSLSCRHDLPGARLPHIHEDDALGGKTAPAHVWRRTGIVTEWNLPHHGKGAHWCGDLLGWSGQQHENGDLSTWRQMELCGQRDCQRCGPKFDGEGNCIQAGTWETRSARRVAEKVEAHLEDYQKTWGFRPKLIHAVLSPPGHEWDDLPANQKTQARWSRLGQKQCDLANEAGIIAGIRVVHGKRVPGKFNDRMHAVDGLHFHIIGLSKQLTTGWLRKEDVLKVHNRTGWVVKRIVDRCRNFHKGACAKICRCNNGSEGPDPNQHVKDGEQVMRGAFGTMLYLLSHASWPSVAVLRMPGEEWTHHGLPLRFNGRYPAFVKTSAQTKAIQPFGDWTQAPETVVVMPLQEDIDPTTGQIVAPGRLYVVLIDGPPPPDITSAVIPKGAYRIDPSERLMVSRGRGMVELPVAHVDAGHLEQCTPDMSSIAQTGKTFGVRPAQAGWSKEEQAEWRDAEVDRVRATGEVQRANRTRAIATLLQVPAGKSWPPKSLSSPKASPTPAERLLSPVQELERALDQQEEEDPGLEERLAKWRRHYRGDTT